jgi:cation diffusion facilitator family transporter
MVMARTPGMGGPRMGELTNAQTEQHMLRRSIALTAFVAAAGILLGLVSGSMSIVFDGLFSAIDMSMLLLALAVARLVTREADRTFQYGYWHIEPMALAFNGGMLTLLCLYAFVNAVKSILGGGQEVELGWAIAYSTVMAVLAFGMFFYERAVNRHVHSELLKLDTQSWLMTALISAALLVAFGFAWAIEGTALARLSPYVDPGILALLSLGLAVMPLSTVRSALREILMITPTDLDRRVREVMETTAARHGFAGFTSYVAKVGRGSFIEIHIVVPPAYEIGTVAALDSIREEIATALGLRWPEHWLTIDFTADERWT